MPKDITKRILTDLTNCISETDCLNCKHYDKHFPACRLALMDDAKQMIIRLDKARKTYRKKLLRIEEE